MNGDIDLWRSVVDDRALLDRAASVDPGDVAGIASLRASGSAQAVSVAMSLVTARTKAAAKFDGRAATLVADRGGVEQASSSSVGRYKARRIVDVLGTGTLIADLCCGIGGDTMAMADECLRVIAVDREPLRAWMAGRNAGDTVQPVAADVADLALDGVAIHLDPARRDERAGRRAWRLEDYQPGPAVIGRLIGHASHAAVKLSPGIDLDAMPWPGEFEFISEHGRLVQAVLWSGGFVGGVRRATRIDRDSVHSLSGEPGSAAMDEAGRYLYTIDPAVERAGLIGRLSSLVDAPLIHPRLGLLTSDRVIGSPWLTGFELIDRMPWRLKRLKRWLSAHDGGVVEVKTRGRAVDPDQVQQQLRGDGGTTYTVFVLRFDTKVEALIAKRL